MIALQLEHSFLLLFGLFISSIVAFGFYYKDKKFSHLPKAWVFLMAFMRFGAVFLLFVLLSGPMLNRTIKVKQKPIIVLLQDNSRSIALASDTSSLNKYHNGINNLISKLNNKYEVRTMSFDDSLRPGLKLSFSGNYTNISLALNEIEQMYMNQNLSAVILASDGIYNRGMDPYTIARRLSFPVYTILLGDTTVYQDIKISTLRTNSIVYLHEKFPVQITLEAKNASGLSTMLTISINGHTIAKKKININKKYFSYQTTFYVKAPSPGKKIITARVTTLEHERNTLNNRASAIIDVIDSRQKILLLSRFPHPDIAVIRRSIKTIPTYKTKFFFFDKFHGQYSDYDLIILYQLPDQSTDVKLLKNELTRADRPVLIVCGPRCDLLRLKAMNIGIEYEPIIGSTDQVQSSVNKTFSIFLPDKGLDQALASLSPLIVPYVTFHNINANNVLLWQKINGLTTGKPLIMFVLNSPINNNKLGIIWGEGLWRWRMTLMRNKQSFAQFDRLISQIIQFLIINQKRKRFDVKVQPVIEQNQEVIFTAQLYDRSYNPITEPQVSLILKDSATNTFKYIFEKSTDHYILNIGKLPKGLYTYAASCQWQNEHFTASGSFVVHPINIEAMSLEANSALLNKIAATTGGKSFFCSQTQKLTNYLLHNNSPKSTVYTKHKIQQGIEQPLLMLLILLTLTIEWFLRKYFGNF